MDILFHILSNPYSIVFFVACIVDLVLLIVTILSKKNSGNTLSLFSLLLIIGFAWSLAQLGISITSGAQYMVWYSLTELFVSILMPVYVCFVLFLVGKEKNLENPLLLIPLVSLSALLLFLYWKTDFVTIHNFSKAMTTPWGYELPRTLIPWDIFIIGVFSFYDVYELISYIIQEKNQKRKQSSGWITFAVLLPIIGGIIFQGIIPTLTQTPELPVTSPLIVIMCLIIGTVLLRHGWEVFTLSGVSVDHIHIIPGSIVTLDYLYQIQNANPSFCELVGKREDEITGKLFMTVVGDETGKFWKSEVFDSFTSGISVMSAETVITGVGGKRIPVTVRATIRRDGSGSVSSIFLVLTDVSEIRAKEQEALEISKRTQEQNVLLEDNKSAMLNLLEDARVLEDKIKDERDRVTVILDTMSEGLCVVDKYGKIVSINPVACQLLQMDSTFLVGKLYAYTVLLYKAGQSISDPATRPLMRTLKTGESFSGGLEENYGYKRPDGTIVPISWSTVALKRDSEIVGAITTFHDISKDLAVKKTIEKKVEERTREISEKNIALERAQKQVSEGWIQQQREKARLTASINSLSLGFILTDMEDHIITMNPASQGIIGLSSRPDDLKVVEGLLQGVVDLHKLNEKCHTEQKPVHIESVLFGRKYLRFFLAPIVIFTNQEEHIGSVILIEDVSEAKTLERSRDEFFSIASHELRTPLTAIRGNTSLIQEHYFDKLEPDMKEMVSDIHESSVRLINIVNDFLNSSRLEQERMEFKNQPFDLADLIKKALREYQVTGSRQKIALDFEEPSSPMPMAFADPERVRQVIINLVGNGMKFTEEGGIKINITQSNGMIEVSVTDTGRGIAMQNQGLLFHKFQQAGDSLFTRDTTKGTGLGLYISKLMIEAMGGKIWLVTSELNKGSTFAFSLPIAKKTEDGVSIPVSSNVVQTAPPS